MASALARVAQGRHPETKGLGPGGRFQHGLDGSLCRGLVVALGSRGLDGAQGSMALHGRSRGCGLIDCLETPMVNEFHEHVLGCKRRMDAIRLLGRRLEDETGA